MVSYALRAVIICACERAKESRKDITKTFTFEILARLLKMTFIVECDRWPMQLSGMVRN